ncbi:MAG TPA: hypothetical protein VG710_11020 [Opitutus sp.]|nr:hypothetical protein [Opitutus sp.]
MRRQLSLVFALIAWLLATGSEWDLVQTFAWGRMIAGYSQRMSFTEAVAKTFTPETMCNLCRVVAAAKQQAGKNPAVPVAKTAGKIPLVCAPVHVVVFGSHFALAHLLAPLGAPVSTGRSAPPSPPPRALA